MSIISRTVQAFQPHFTAEKCGIAGAIRHGRARLENSTTLILAAPPLDLRSPADIPYHSPAASANLLAIELNRQGIAARLAEVSLQPNQAALGQEVFHRVVEAQEGGESYCLGLTPFDQLIGIYPFKPAGDPAVVSFFRAGTPSETRYFDPPAAAEQSIITDNPSWDLARPEISSYALASRLDQNGRLFETYLGFRPARQKTFILHYGTMVLAYAGRRSALTQVNSFELAVQFWPHELQTLTQRAQRCGTLANFCSGLPARYAFSNTKLYDEIEEAMLAHWPVVIEFMQKITPPLLEYSSYQSAAARAKVDRDLRPKN